MTTLNQRTLKFPPEMNKNFKNSSPIASKTNSYKTLGPTDHSQFPTCSGVTVKGLPCKRRVKKPGQTCYSHSPEVLSDLIATLTIADTTNKSTKTTPGYIYMYTLDSTHGNVHVYDDRANGFIPITKYKNKNNDKFIVAENIQKRSQRSTMSLFQRAFTKLSDTHSKSSSKKSALSKPFPKSPDRMILVKVGYTRKTPAKRIAEWKAKCRHPIVLLSPPARQTPKNFSQTHLGWVTADPQTAESSIHSELRGLFGSGHVECEGCLESSGGGGGGGTSGSDRKNAKKRNRHQEWFLVKQSRLRLVFESINYWTSVYKTSE